MQIFVSATRLIILFVASAAAVAYGGLPRAGFYENSTSAALINLIDSATRTIDVEIYQMEDPLVHKALLSAQRAGVRIRILQEPTPYGSSCRLFGPVDPLDSPTCLRMKEFRDLIRQNGGIYEPFRKALCGGGAERCVEHGKMVIVDAKAALLSTGNFNSSNLCHKIYGPKKCNRDYSYITRYKGEIKTLGRIFERDLAGAPYDLEAIVSRPEAGSLTVSPYSMRPLVRFIRSARSTLMIQQQYLNDPEMNAALMEAARRGVKLSIMVASVCSFGVPTPLDSQQWTETYSTFEKAGARIRIFTQSIRVGGLPGYLHAKAIVIDGKFGWVGSVNGSTQSIAANREYGLFFDRPADVNALAEIMVKDFRNPGGESWQDSLRCKKDRGVGSELR